MPHAAKDQDDSDFDKGEGLRFHYRYEDDGGGAMLPNGHWVNVPNGNVVDQSQTSALGSGCHFSGVAFFAPSTCSLLLGCLHI